MEKSQSDPKVQELLCDKFKVIEEIERKKAEVAKINAELARLGYVAAVPRAW